MAEYIEREAYRDLFTEERCLYSCAEIKEFVDAIPAADVQPTKWIPVTERLPEEYKNVLCYYEYFRYGDFNCMFRTIDRGYYGNGGWGGEAGQGYKNKVLAWMPLPKPPKDGEI